MVQKNICKFITVLSRFGLFPNKALIQLQFFDEALFLYLLDFLAHFLRQSWLYCNNGYINLKIPATYDKIAIFYFNMFWLTRLSICFIFYFSALHFLYNIFQALKQLDFVPYLLKLKESFWFYTYLCFICFNALLCSRYWHHLKK